jgi:hypothetical protein
VAFHRNPRAEGPTWLDDDDYEKAVERNRLEARYSGLVGTRGQRSITRALQQAPQTWEGYRENVESFAREFGYAATHGGAELPEAGDDYGGEAA